jgi:predicted RNase H-like HicB family nuclease
MKLYKLPFVMHEPSKETEDKYMAEIPALPGCRAWGDTAAQALENLQSVATVFIESYRAHGDSIPPQVGAASLETVEPRMMSEVLVAV